MSDRLAADSASIQEITEKDLPDILQETAETLSDGPSDQVKESVHVSSHAGDNPSDVSHCLTAIPEVLDEHMVPSNKDILKYLKEEGESKTLDEMQDQTEATVLPHTP